MVGLVTNKMSAVIRSTIRLRLDFFTLNQGVFASQLKSNANLHKMGNILKARRTAIALMALLGSHLVAQEDTKNYEAEILRSVSGHALDEKEFSRGSVPLRKGMVYPVLEQSFSDVILDDDGELRWQRVMCAYLKSKLVS